MWFTDKNIIVFRNLYISKVWSEKKWIFSLYDFNLYFEIYFYVSCKYFDISHWIIKIKRVTLCLHKTKFQNLKISCAGKNFQLEILNFSRFPAGNSKCWKLPTVVVNLPNNFCVVFYTIIRVSINFLWKKFWNTAKIY